jgi:hypothetical protein
MSLASNRFAILSTDDDEEEVIPTFVEPPKKPDPIDIPVVPLPPEQVREFKGFEGSKNVFKPFSAYAFRDDNDSFAKFHRPKPKSRQQTQTQTQTQTQPLYRPVTPPFYDFVQAPSTFAERVRNALLKEESVHTESRFPRIEMSNLIPMRVKFGIASSVELDISESELPVELLGAAD